MTNLLKNPLWRDPLSKPKPTRELIVNSRTMPTTKRYIQHTTELKDTKFYPLGLLTQNSKDHPNNKYF